MPEVPSFWHENLTKVPPMQRKKQLPRHARHLKFLSDLPLSIRTEAFLEAGGVETVDQLIAFTADELLDLRSFGETSLREVRQRLADYNLKLKGD